MIPVVAIDLGLSYTHELNVNQLICHFHLQKDVKRRSEVEVKLQTT